MKKLIVICLTLLLIVGCGKEEEKPVYFTEGELEGVKYKETAEVTTNIKIQMEDTSIGIILLELYPDIAPITVENFQKLISEKFFDGTKFHRVVKNFMIQGGISSTDVEAENIKGEFLSNGVDNYLKHERGIISMARGGSMDSASSQFFIMHKANSGLDRDYAAFGKVIAGMDTVDKIANTPVDNPNSDFPIPLTDQIVKSIRFVNIEN